MHFDKNFKEWYKSINSYYRLSVVTGGTIKNGQCAYKLFLDKCKQQNLIMRRDTKYYFFHEKDTVALIKIAVDVTTIVDNMLRFNKSSKYLTVDYACAILGVTITELLTYCAVLNIEGYDCVSKEEYTNIKRIFDNCELLSDLIETYNNGSNPIYICEKVCTNIITYKRGGLLYISNSDIPKAIQLIQNFESRPQQKVLSECLLSGYLGYKAVPKNLAIGDTSDAAIDYIPLSTITARYKIGRDAVKSLIAPKSTIKMRNGVRCVSKTDYLTISQIMTDNAHWGDYMRSISNLSTSAITHFKQCLASQGVGFIKIGGCVYFDVEFKGFILQELNKCIKNAKQYFKEHINFKHSRPPKKPRLKYEQAHSAQH